LCARAVHHSFYTSSVYNEIRRWDPVELSSPRPQFSQSWHFQTWTSTFGGPCITGSGMLLFGTLEGVRGLRAQ
jgi:hypothetical protein